MPLDQSIIQAGMPPSLTQESLMAPQIAQQKLAESQADTQTKQLAAKQAQMNMDAQRALDSALSDATTVGPDGKAAVDWDKAHGRLAQMGYGRASLQADTMRDTAAQEAWKAKQEALKYQTDLAHAAGSVVLAIPDVNEGEQDPTKLAAQKGAWQASTLDAIPKLVGLGAIDRATASQYQQIVAQQGWTPQFAQYIKGLRAQGETVEQHAQDLDRQVKDAKAQALLGTQVADAQQERAGRILSTATDATSYDRLMSSLKDEGMSNHTLDKFEQQWSPTAAATALHLATKTTDIAKSQTPAAATKELATALEVVRLANPKDQASYDAALAKLDPAIKALLPGDYTPDILDRIATVVKTGTTAAKKPSVGSEMVPYLIAVGTKDLSNPTQAEANAALAKKTEEIKAGRPPAAAVLAAAASGINDDDYKRAGEEYARTGIMPSLGRDSTGRLRIEHEKQQFARENSLTPRDLALMASAYRGDTQSLVQLQKSRDQIVSFEQTARKNLDLFLDAASKIPDTGVPWINSPLRTLDEKAIGSANMAAVNAARQVANNEIAKVTSGGSISGVLSDAARKEVASYNPADATFAQTKKVADVLRREMANRHESLDGEIGQIKDRIGTTPNSTPAAGPSATPATPTVPDAVKNLLSPASVKPGVHKLSDGSKWMKNQDGTITPQ